MPTGDYTAAQLEAMRSIVLYDWERLSEGDISIVVATLQDPSSLIGTLRHTPHADFWTKLAILDWATIVPDSTLGPEGLECQLTDLGREMLPEFIRQKQLTHVGSAARKFFGTESEDEVFYRDVRTKRSETSLKENSYVSLVTRVLRCFNLAKS